jgi:hypothetical protein
VFWGHEKAAYSRIFRRRGGQSDVGVSVDRGHRDIVTMPNLRIVLFHTRHVVPEILEASECSDSNGILKAARRM